MVSMKLTPDEAKKMSYLGCTPESDPGDLPKYPYGLCLDLDDEALAKLGMTEPPAVGAVMTLTARVEVRRVSSNEQQDSDKDVSVGLQITDMDLAPEAAPAGQMYPNSGMAR